MFEWNSSYSVGVSEFDEAHKQLFRYYNEFHEAMVQGKSQATIANILDNTLAYAKKHFANSKRNGWLPRTILASPLTRNSIRSFRHKSKGSSPIAKPKRSL